MVPSETEIEGAVPWGLTVVVVELGVGVGVVVVGAGVVVWSGVVLGGWFGVGSG